MAATRRAYTGAAVSTTTASSIAASGTTSFTITAYTGWPYGSDPFYVVVEPGTASEEKILVTRTGSTDTTINVASDSERGQDGTSAVSHSSGSTVFPVFTSVDADEANAVASVITADTTNGRIGIGTATPAAELDVAAAVAPVIQLTSEKNGTWVADDPFGEINFYGKDVSGGGPGYRSRILSVAQDTFGYEGELAFHTTNASTGDTEVVRIDSSGNVGVGTSSPSYKLDVDGDINATGDLRIGGTAIGNWTSFTPVWTNLTVGNGVQTANYCRVNDLVVVQFRLTLGSTTVVGSGPSFDLPVNSAGYVVYHSVGTATYYNVGTAVNTGYLADNGSNRVLLRTFIVSGTFVSSSGIGATAPFTWTTGDQMMGTFTYRAA